MISEDGSIKAKVYCKETYIDQYIHFSSNHPLEHKRDLVKTLMHRVNIIVSDERDKVIEKSHIKQALIMNDYTDDIGKSKTVIGETEG